MPTRNRSRGIVQFIPCIEHLAEAGLERFPGCVAGIQKSKQPVPSPSEADAEARLREAVPRLTGAGSVPDGQVEGRIDSEVAAEVDGVFAQ
jgi:hypothetical protein